MPNYWKCLESHCAIAATVNSPLMYNTEHLLKTWPHIFGPLMYNTVNISWRHGHTSLVCSLLMYNTVSISWRHGHTSLVYSPPMYNSQHLLGTWPHIFGPLMYNTVSISWWHGHTFLAYSPLMYHCEHFLPQYTHCWSHSHIHPMAGWRMPCTSQRVCTPSTNFPIRAGVTLSNQQSWMHNTVSTLHHWSQSCHCWAHSHIHPMVGCRMPCTPLRVRTPSPPCFPIRAGCDAGCRQDLVVLVDSNFTDIIISRRWCMYSKNRPVWMSSSNIYWLARNLMEVEFSGED